MEVSIIDYGSGNLRSVAKAFEYSAKKYGIRANINISNDSETIQNADRIVLPGVGAFGDCRDGIRAIPKLWDTIEKAVGEKKIPFMGICVGMQLMATKGEEFGTYDGFNWIGGVVGNIKKTDNIKIPHMGWNNLTFLKTHPLLDDIDIEKHTHHAYFTHSYHFTVEDQNHIIANTHHGQEITAIVAKENMVGMQFHPEKSQQFGLRLIGNFLRRMP